MCSQSQLVICLNCSFINRLTRCIANVTNSVSLYCSTLLMPIASPFLLYGMEAVNLSSRELNTLNYTYTAMQCNL